MKLNRYYGIVLGFARGWVHFNFQIAYYEKDNHVKTRYWGIRIGPAWPPLTIVKGIV